MTEEQSREGAAEVDAAPGRGGGGGGGVEVDLLTQACKALCERSPYDAVVEDDGYACNLPAGLATLLRQSVGRRKRRKSHLGSEGKGKGKWSVWVETEDYFRDVTLGDVEELGRLSSGRVLVESKSYLIPRLGIGRGRDERRDENLNENDNSNGNVGVKVEERKEADGKAIDADVKDVEMVDVVVDEESRSSDSSSLLDPLRGLDWILGFRNKDYLTTERPTRKRKRLGSDAGLQKVLIPCPCEGNASICDYCCTGDVWGELNPLITCSSCNVAVHRKCYVGQDATNDPWTCSWCSQMSGDKDTGTPCILCSKSGGALKPVHKTDEEGGPKDFAHLFCVQWIPEVYIDDLVKLEPVMNVGGIKDVRRKLICNICKVKRGACVRCSHGSCRTSFHPICAREAGQRMEIWGKYGCDDVELRAFCSKHSKVQSGSGTPGRTNSVAAHSDSPLTTNDLLAVSSDDHDLNRVLKTLNLEKNGSENGSMNEPFNLALILRKLIDCGKVTIETVASEIGIKPHSLALALAQDGNLVAELRSKLFRWFKSHAFMGVSQRNLSVQLEPTDSCKAEYGVDEPGESILLESDALNVKTVSAQYRTRDKITNLRDKKAICLCMEIPGKKGLNIIEINSNQPGDSHIFRKTSLNDDATENILEDRRLLESSQCEGEPAEGPSCCISCGYLSQRSCIPNESMSLDENIKIPYWSDAADGFVNGLLNAEADGHYVHPYMYKLWDLQTSSLSCNPLSDSDGLKEVTISPKTCLTANVRCNHENRCLSCSDKTDPATGFKIDVKGRDIEIVGLSPEDELEGEIIYLQHKLLGKAVETKQFTDNLVSEVAKRLPHEVELARRQGWDAVVVNQYLSELREATKRGRKERKHKEAQAALVATSTAAAVSSRPAFRKDLLEESASQENLTKLNTSSGRASLSSQLMPWAKETLTRVAAPRISLERNSGFAQSISSYTREQPRSCDICECSETNINRIVVCSGCKVSVHLDCYRAVQEPTGPWYCDLCEELILSKSFGNSSASTVVAECCLCGGSAGVFRKTTEGNWVHAFCAEWVFESKVRGGQVNSFEGVEKGVDTCCICHQKLGVCIKCDQSHCQATFHPLCARSAGFDVKLKSFSGKGQHKAYCEKHSLEQRANQAENRKHEFEELTNIKQLRVELERLRLLCERIVRREKIKHEIVSCANEILASKRDCVGYSLHMNHPYFRNDSSESVTTSLGGPDEYKLSDDIFQNYDDATVLFKHEVADHGWVDADQRTDDSSTTQQNSSTGMVPCRQHDIASSNDLEYKEQAGRLEQKLMTNSEQALEKNQLLRNGHFYIPEDSLPKR